MAGIYLNEKKILKSIQIWMNTCIPPYGKWGGNNLHIDEIYSFKKIERSEWLNGVIKILNILLKHYQPEHDLILFLHIDIKYSLKKMLMKKLTSNWLEKYMDKYTPPSLNLTSLKYYEDFYKKELIPCKTDNRFMKLIHSPENLHFFYRTYFDKRERMYSREIYIFINYKENN